METMKCRLTGSELVPVFDLGVPCVSDFAQPGTEQAEGTPFPLCVGLGREWPHLPQLTQSYPPAAMYKRYHYRSGTNEAMRRELRDVVEKANRIRPVAKGEDVLDIACNDGTLLLEWERHLGNFHANLTGIDPSDVARDAAYQGFNKPYYLINDFFSASAYNKATGEPASIITCIAMFYDLDDPVGFLRQVRSCLRDDGLFVLQVHHAGMMLETNAFDAICHEHLAYYDSRQLFFALSRAGFGVVDAEITSSNGGSIRLYAMPQESACRYARTIEGIAGAERWTNILHRDRGRHGPRGSEGDGPYSFDQEFARWERFAAKVECIRGDVLGFLAGARRDGKSVIGLGASTKGNTLLQFFGIGPELLPAIADRQEHKAGLVTVGSGIPIITESEMRARKPDYLFVLPWHFTDQLCQREADLIAGGTRLFAPLPNPRLV